MTDNQRILLIDDSELVVEAIREGLEGDQVDVEAVVNLGAIDKSQSLDRFDLILIDVQMPEMFGDDVAMVLRKGRSVASPILLVSSLPESELAARASEAGVDGYISKRRGIDGVLDEIRGWLAGTKRKHQQDD